MQNEARTHLKLKWYQLPQIMRNLRDRVSYKQKVPHNGEVIQTNSIRNYAYKNKCTPYNQAKDPFSVDPIKLW